MDLGVAAGDVIVDRCAAHHAVVHQQTRDLHVVQQRRAVRASPWRRTAAASASRPSWRRAPARRPSASGFSIGSRRSACCGVSCSRRDVRRLAPLEEARQVRHVLVGDRDEQPVVLLERARRDLPEDAVLLDALHGGLVVVHGVARAAVQQAVVATGRAGRELAALDERDAQAAQREVVRERAAGSAAADDQDMCVV